MPKKNIYNELYARARSGEHFKNLMPLVLSRENILLAYRNIKKKTGSNTAGSDKLTITDIGKLTPEEVTAKVRYIVSGTRRGYRPKTKRKHASIRNPLYLGQTNSANTVTVSEQIAPVERQVSE